MAPKEINPESPSAQWNVNTGTMSGSSFVSIPLGNNEFAYFLCLNTHVATANNSPDVNTPIGETRGNWLRITRAAALKYNPASSVPRGKVAS